MTTFTFFRNEESCQQEPSPLTFFRKMPVNASADSPDLSVRPPSPIPSPSGGGCRPQGRQERENVTGPRCGNDRNCWGMRTIVPSAGGQVLPLPSSASWGIGGCHLPPLGEGKSGCGFAETLSCGKVLLRNAGDGIPYKALFSCVDGGGKADGTKRTQRLM